MELLDIYRDILRYLEQSKGSTAQIDYYKRQIDILEDMLDEIVVNKRIRVTRLK